MGTIQIKPLGTLPMIGDVLMAPLMWAFVGFREAPQRSHVWNNRRLSPHEHASITQQHLVMCGPDKDAQPRGTIRLHLPVCMGGWRQYVVINPKTYHPIWYIGWYLKEWSGISQIPLTTPVRVLIGDGPVGFFGVDIEGNQIQVERSGDGNIGVRSQYSWLPLR